MSESLASLQKGLLIVQCLAGASSGLPVAELARRTDLNRSSVYRLCRMLEQHDWVRRQPVPASPGKTTFTLGPQALRLSILIMSTFDPKSRLQLLISELAHRLQEAVHGGALDGTEVVHIARGVPDSGITMAAHLGAREHAHVTALGKALLATLPEREVLAMYGNADLPVRTVNSISLVSALRAELKLVREAGYATEREESRRGIMCVAAPVFDAASRAVFAISVTTAPGRLEGGRLGEVIDEVKATASAATRALGGIAPEDWNGIQDAQREVDEPRPRA